MNTESQAFEPFGNGRTESDANGNCSSGVQAFNDGTAHDQVAAEPDLFIALFTKHQFRVYGYILTLIPSTTDADEVLQETSITAWSKFAEFTPGTDFVAWVCRIAHFKVLKLFNERRNDRLRFGEEFMSRVSQVAERHSDEFELRQQSLANCVQSLPARDRELVVECYASDGIPKKELAKRLGRPATSIYRSLARIHGILLDCIRRQIDREERLS